MRSLVKSLLTGVALSFTWVNMSGITANRGGESTQFVINYSDDTRHEFECASYEDLLNYSFDNLVADVKVTQFPEYCEVEWRVENALCYNYVTSGEISYIFNNGFYWSARTGMVATKYVYSAWNGYESMTPDMEEGYMIPGTIDEFILNDGMEVSDVTAEIISVESVKVTPFHLIPWMADQFDVAPAESKCERSVGAFAKSSSERGESLQVTLLNKGVASKTGCSLIFAVPFGITNGDDMASEAVTSIKYRVYGARYKSRQTSVPVMNEYDAAPRWYTLQGLPVAEPQSGQLLIRVAGGRAEKVRY